MRLIDADTENCKLLDFIAEHDSSIQYAIEHKDREMLEDIFLDYFESQKVAYDVDGVVEQLNKMQVYQFQGKLPNGRICHFSDAIEMVKAGGINENR